MANKLFEAYKNRIAVAEKLHMQSHGGARMNDQKKIVLSRVLDNTSRFLNEAFENSVGTQRSDMGLFKKFCLNISNIVLPNLIAYDLVMTVPMTGYTGYVTYLEFAYGSKKGQTNVGDLIESPFARGKVDANFTANLVEESKNFAESTTSIALAWAPVVPGTVSFKIDTYLDDGAGKIYKYTDGTEVTVLTNYVTEATDPNNGNLEGVAGRYVKTITGATEAGTIAYGLASTKGVRTGGVEPIYDSANAAVITLTTGVTGTTAIKYNYNNIAIPQNDLPTITAQMKGIALEAKARRIAVFYSQLAAFQAKTDYNQDIGELLSKRAVAELGYEIDTEIVNGLVDTAVANTSGDEAALLTFDRTRPIGISLDQHLESFAYVIENAAQIIYKRTQKYRPNYMVIAPDVLPVVAYLKGWQPTNSVANGPYHAGTVNGIKVFVSPNMAEGRFILGLNNNDLAASAAVYAPYMSIVPTQLLGFADGGMTQGFSTLYDFKILNPLLLVAGTITGNIYGVVGNSASPVYTATNN